MTSGSTSIGSKVLLAMNKLPLECKPEDIHGSSGIPPQKRFDAAFQSSNCPIIISWHSRGLGMSGTECQILSDTRHLAYNERYGTYISLQNKLGRHQLCWTAPKEHLPRIKHGIYNLYHCGPHSQERVVPDGWVALACTVLSSVFGSSHYLQFADMDIHRRYSHWY